MVKANAGLHIDESIEDCKSKKTFNLLITENLANLVLQRKYINDNNEIEVIEKPDQVLNKKIKLRSPLYCKSENGICPTCYGNLYKVLNTRNIGILAAGAINTVGINAMMKMRHKSSSISTKEVDFIELARKAGVDINSFKDVLIIEKNTITAKVPCSIIIDDREYDDLSLIDCGDKYRINGVLNIQYGSPDDLRFITLPYAIIVDCFKPADMSKDGHIIVMNYEPGELIIKQDYYDDAFNERTVDRLFEGGAKYITNPETLVMTIQDKITGIDLVHIETVVSNMFRDRDDPIKPARLTNYKNFEIIGQKRLPYVISWLSSLSFENINRAIKIGLLRNKDAVMDPIEKIVMEQYRELGY